MARKKEEEYDDLNDGFEDEQDINTQDSNDNFDNFDDLSDDDDGFDADFSDMGGGFGSGISPMEKHNDLLKDLTNFSPYLKDKINGWLGLVWNDEKGKYVQDPATTPIMNTQCAKWCIDKLRTYTRNNNILTHISKEDYIQIQEDLIETFWLNLGTRAEEFALYNNGDLLAVCVDLQHAVMLVLMGAGDGKYSNVLKETVNRNESVSYSQPMGQQQQNMQQQIGQQRPNGFLARMGSALKNGGN